MEIALDEPERKQQIPCVRYTIPESTITKWDWTAHRYDFHYQFENGTEGLKTVDSPFHNDEGFDFHPNTAHFAHHPGEELADYQVIDGWELLFRNFGTVNEAVAEPSFGLYNRYDARVRIFFYLDPRGNIPCQNGRILASHFTGNESFENASALFEHLNIPANTLVEFDKSGLEVSQLNEVYCDNGTWMYLEFIAAYDPCVCLYPSAVKIKPVLSAVSELNFKLTGTGVSNAIYPTNNAPPSFSDYSKTALKYVDGFGSYFKAGFKTFKTSNNILPGTQFYEGLGMVLPNFLPQISAGVKLLALFVGGGKSSTPSKLMGFNHDFTFDGVGEITTYENYLPVLLYTPGAFFDYGQEKANRPIYDNPLGIFTILEPPVIEVNYDHYDSGSDGESIHTTYRFKGDLKYAVNELAGINKTPIRLMGALTFFQCANLPSTQFYSTPLINIECLPDYIMKGHKSVVIKDGVVVDISEGGCIGYPALQIVAVLENTLHPTADDILFSARYRPEYIDAEYNYSEAPDNPFEEMTAQEIFAVCDPPVPAPISGKNLVDFCEKNYDPTVKKSIFKGGGSSKKENPIQLTDPVYPNPFTDYFVITIQKEWINQKINLRLQDVLGKTVWQKEFFVHDAGFLQIHKGLSILPSGQYYAQIQGENFNTTFNLIKQ